MTDKVMSKSDQRPRSRAKKKERIQYQCELDPPDHVRLWELLNKHKKRIHFDPETKYNLSKNLLLSFLAKLEKIDKKCEEEMLLHKESEKYNDG